MWVSDATRRGSLKVQAPTEAVSVSAQMELVTSAPMPSSGLYSFGDNSEGNLGTGENAPDASSSATPLPVSISTPVRFVSVAAGLFHSLALSGT